MGGAARSGDDVSQWQHKIKMAELMHAKLYRRNRELEAEVAALRATAGAPTTQPLAAPGDASDVGAGRSAAGGGAPRHGERRERKNM
jgi:hypothetical protein